MKNFEAQYLTNIQQLFRYYKSLGNKALARLDAAQLHQAPGGEASNTVAVIVKHLHGNMLSRWTDFLESDGEKAWRQREQEFEDSLESKEAVLEAWEEGWACLFKALDPLTAGDMERIVYIRKEGHSLLEALNRQLAHYAYHVGQIVYVAKSLLGNDWESLSIARGASERFNAEKFSQEKRRKNFI